MKRADLDELSIGELLDMPAFTSVDDFDKEIWRSAWFECVEMWWEDGEALHDVMRSGFKGFLDRSDFTIYCDIRFTHAIETQEQWLEVAASANKLGKYS